MWLDFEMVFRVLFYVVLAVPVVVVVVVVVRFIAHSRGLSKFQMDHK